MAEEAQTVECVICGEMFTSVSKDGVCSRCIREAGLQLRIRMLEAEVAQRNAAIQRVEAAEAALASLRTALRAKIDRWKNYEGSDDCADELRALIS